MARRAQHLICVALAVLAPVAAQTETITSARFTEPTSRYAHGVLGDEEEWGALEIRTENLGDDGGGLSSSAAQRRTTFTIRLPLVSVFEDVAPRLADVDGDGKPEVVVVEAHRDFGARLAIYNTKGLIAATPHIGTRFRWLAPIAIADMDGDGAVELAYIDRPHLAKTLRVWRFQDDALTQIASLENLTNHRIGERNIAGGLRDCDKGAEMVVASGDWQHLMGITFDGEQLYARTLGPHRDRSSFTTALACK